MKKSLLILFLVLTTILSCEKDDICIEPNTPNLLITFYNKDTTDLKKSVTGLSVWIDGKEKIYDTKTLDSISIPIDINAENTHYKFASEDIEDDINFTYNRNDIFISRSCGYKTIFENFSIENYSQNWINSIEILNTTIENETTAHIHIYH